MNIKRSFKGLGLMIVCFFAMIFFAIIGTFCGVLICGSVNIAACLIGLASPSLPEEINRIIIFVVGCYIIYLGLTPLILKIGKSR